MRLVGRVGDIQAAEWIVAGHSRNSEDGREFVHRFFGSFNACRRGSFNEFGRRSDELVARSSDIAGDIVVERQSRRLALVKQVDIFDQLLKSPCKYLVVLNDDRTVAGIVTRTSMTKAVGRFFWGAEVS